MTPFPGTSLELEQKQARGTGGHAGRKLPNEQPDPLLEAQEGDRGRTPETQVLPRPAPRRISYPEWPTSRPGPMITPAPFGEHPHVLRSEQMIYDERYNQEQGQPGVSPTDLAVRKGNTKRYQPDDVPLDVAVPMD